MTVVKRSSPASLLQAKATQYLAIREEEKQVKSRKAFLNKYLTDQIDQFGEVDPLHGHRALTLPEAVEVAGKTYRSLQRQRRVSMSFDEDVAEDTLRRLGIYEEATQTLVVLDQDKVYALHQQGRISDKEMDEILVENVTYALVPLAE